jgi:hypothetical protein
VLEGNHNAGLSSIDLGPLRSVNVLSIQDNAALSDVALRDIETVNFLSVVDNANLDATELRERADVRDRGERKGGRPNRVI